MCNAVDLDYEDDSLFDSEGEVIDTVEQHRDERGRLPPFGLFEYSENGFGR
jgi:hypothetical protein